MKLYNNEIKETYIQEIDKEIVMPSNYLNRLFSNISIYEEELGKDACNFTAYEIVEYYKILNISSFDSLVVINSQLSKYTQWCLNNNLVKDNQNHYYEIPIKQLKNCINNIAFNKKIVTQEDIYKWSNELPNPKDKFILVGLFEGIKGKEFCELAKLKPEDIKGNVAYLCSNREIHLSDKLVKIIKDCLNEDKYYSISGNAVKQTTLVYNGYVLKDYPNVKDNVSDFQIGRKVYNSIIRSLSFVGAAQFVSANSIFESGKIHMILKRSKELNMTPEEYIYSDYIKEVENRYNCKIVKSIFLLKYKECMI